MVRGRGRWIFLFLWLMLAVPAAGRCADEEVVSFIIRGNEYLEKSDLRKALDEFDKAVSFIKNAKIEASFPIVYFNRGRVYEKMNMPVEAVDDYSRAIELDKKYMLPYYNRGLLHQKREEFDLALADYSTMLALDDKQIHAYNNRGLVYYSKGQITKAIADFTRAIELNANTFNVHLNRGLAYLCQRDYIRAREDFFLEKEKFPHSVSAWLVYTAVSSYMDKNYETCLKAVRRLQELGYELGPEFATDVNAAMGRQVIVVTQGKLTPQIAE